jgi:hypothetical protein
VQGTELLIVRGSCSGGIDDADLTRALFFCTELRSYEIAKGTHSPDMLGAPLLMFNPSASKSSFEVAFNGTYGNPAIQFDSSVNATPNVLVHLSLANAQPIDEKYFENQISKTTTSTSAPITSAQELLLTEDLSDIVCASLGEPGNPINPVFALFNGSYWIHDPRFVSHVYRQWQLLSRHTALLQCTHALRLTFLRLLDT